MVFGAQEDIYVTHAVLLSRLHTPARQVTGVLDDKI